MIEFICLFMPAFISLNNKSYKNKLDIILDYVIYNLFINIITMILICLYKREIVDVFSNFNVMQFCIKYLIISIIMAISISFVEKNIHLKIEIRKVKNAKSK